MLSLLSVTLLSVIFVSAVHGHGHIFLTTFSDDACATASVTPSLEFKFPRHTCVCRQTSPGVAGSPCAWLEVNWNKTSEMISYQGYTNSSCTTTSQGRGSWSAQAPAHSRRAAGHGPATGVGYVTNCVNASGTTLDDAFGSYKLSNDGSISGILQQTICDTSDCSTPATITTAPTAAPTLLDTSSSSSSNIWWIAMICVLVGAIIGAGIVALIWKASSTQNEDTPQEAVTSHKTHHAGITPPSDDVTKKPQEAV